MNVKTVAKFAGSALGAGSAARSFAKAKRESDRLRMVDALLSVASAAVTIAIVVREMRAGDEAETQLIDIEDRS
ncbi:hypothetical protein CLV30_103229 [Haloactinopolyspora alba]|uniref:Uncharacterized protein n=1 Tax=Haloactinopolyspora alba TaxID=648780 RepID=A0A2P8E9E7_9ACTN|nr:hypothetical protein [Haloactinopolyspora alba]PSL06074.1 hypothetical protein CLV30_103229 [Haloactinopolyspora alba]